MKRQWTSNQEEDVNLRQAAARAASAVRGHRAARERQASACEADRLWAIADTLDRQQGRQPGYQHQLTAERTARIQARLGENFVRDARGQAAAAAGEPLEHWAISAEDVAPTAGDPTQGCGHGPELDGDELDAEINRLAAQYPEPGMSVDEEVQLAQGPEAWESLNQQYQRETGAPHADRDATAGGPDYYRAAHGGYQPDWIPREDGEHLAAWDRYWTSQPGSDEHKAAYADMHREAAGRGFPGPDPELSYLADHGYADEGYLAEQGYGFGANRFSAPEADEDSAEPADAEADEDAARWGPESGAPDHPYGARECAEADPETAHFGNAPGEPQDAGRWAVLPLADPAASLQADYERLCTPQYEAEAG